jgi:hypothetical protein
LPVNRNYPTIGRRIRVMDGNGTLLATIEAISAHGTGLGHL